MNNKNDVPRHVADLEDKLSKQLKERFSGLGFYTETRKVENEYYLDIVLDTIPFNPLNPKGEYSKGFLQMYKQINTLLKPETYTDPTVIICIDPERLHTWKNYGWTR